MAMRLLNLHWPAISARQVELLQLEAVSAVDVEPDTHRAVKKMADFALLACRLSGLAPRSPRGSTPTPPCTAGLGVDLPTVSRRFRMSSGSRHTSWCRWAAASCVCSRRQQRRCCCSCGCCCCGGGVRHIQRRRCCLGVRCTSPQPQRGGQLGFLLIAVGVFLVVDSSTAAATRPASVSHIAAHREVAIATLAAVAVAR